MHDLKAECGTWHCAALVLVPPCKDGGYVSIKSHQCSSIGFERRVIPLPALLCGFADARWVGAFSHTSNQKPADITVHRLSVESTTTSCASLLGVDPRAQTAALHMGIRVPRPASAGHTAGPADTFDRKQTPNHPAAFEKSVVWVASLRRCHHGWRTVHVGIKQDWVSRENTARCDVE